jgi:hypothetical protein
VGVCGGAVGVRVATMTMGEGGAWVPGEHAATKRQNTPRKAAAGIRIPYLLRILHSPSHPARRAIIHQKALALSLQLNLWASVDSECAQS